MLKVVLIGAFIIFGIGALVSAGTLYDAASVINDVSHPLSIDSLPSTISDQLVALGAFAVCFFISAGSIVLATRVD